MVVHVSLCFGVVGIWLRYDEEGRYAGASFSCADHNGYFTSNDGRRFGHGYHGLGPKLVEETFDQVDVSGRFLFKPLH